MSSTSYANASSSTPLSSSARIAAREDPWPSMAKQVEEMLNDLERLLQRFRETPHPTLAAENELLEAIGSCSEAVEDMRFALDTAMEHPESFAIETDELQSRAGTIRAWERDMVRAQQTSERIRDAQRKRLQEREGVDDASGGTRENNDFLRQEHEVQREIQHTDEQTLDRLSSGIHRVRDTAVNITDELNTQEHILDDIDSGMTRAQIKLEGTVKKVARLLDQTSDRGKMICIAVLFVILILLIVFVCR